MYLVYLSFKFPYTYLKQIHACPTILDHCYLMMTMLYQNQLDRHYSVRTWTCQLNGRYDEDVTVTIYQGLHSSDRPITPAADEQLLLSSQLLFLLQGNILVLRDLQGGRGRVLALYSPLYFCGALHTPTTHAHLFFFFLSKSIHIIFLFLSKVNVKTK